MSSASARATLVGLAILFIGPMVMAWLMYTGVIDYRPKETRNHGTLIQPPVEAELPEDFAQSRLTEHWVVVYPLSSPCGEPCRRDVAGLRQVRRALGRDGSRIRIVLLAGKSMDDAARRDIAAIDAESSVISGGAGMLREQLRGIEGGRGTYVIDPIGNIMMHYAAGSDPNDIRQDLERLLRYAKTDPRE